MLTDKKLNNPLYAVHCMASGLRLIARPGLRPYVLIPLLVNFVLFSLAFWFLGYYLSDLIDWLLSFVPSWLEWLSWILWPLFLLSFAVVTFFSFTMVANLIASPFYGFLAEKAEKIVLGVDISQDQQESIFKTLISGMTSELKRIGYFLLRALPLLILFVIPGVNVIAPFVWMLFSAWFLALEYSAYPLENHGILFTEQRQRLKKTRLGATSFGAVAMLGLAVPVLNILIPPAAVIGATIYVMGRKDETASSESLSAPSK